MLTVKVIDTEMSPYCQAIQTALIRDFSGFQCNQKELTDVLTEILIGSRQLRNGPRPDPETLVMVRNNIRNTINTGDPFRFIIPMGPKKTQLFKSVDLAEMSALRNLLELKQNISSRYKPGAIFRFRVEDATGYFLENDIDPMDLQTTINRYVAKFKQLCNIVDPTIEIFSEQENCDMRTFHQLGEKYSLYLFEYLKDTDFSDFSETDCLNLDSFKNLKKLGWTGTIPMEQRQYYYQTYQHLYPNHQMEHYQMMLARYFGLSLARYHLGLVGKEHWQNAIDLTFANPIPGSPIGGKLFYRTVPLNQSKRHVPFWRTKGIAKINGTTTISLHQNWNDPEIIPCTAIVSNGVDEVEIDSDYIIV